MQFANQFVSFSKFSVLLRGECESALRPMKVLVACFGVALGCERIGGEYYSGQNSTYHTNGMNMNADYCCGWCCGAKGQGARSYAWKDMWRLAKDPVCYCFFDSDSVKTSQDSMTGGRCGMAGQESIPTAPANPAILPQVSQVCVINHADFVLGLIMQNQRTRKYVTWSNVIGQKVCIDLGATSEGRNRDVFQINVDGATPFGNVEYRDNGISVAFECKGVGCSLLGATNPDDELLV